MKRLLCSFAILALVSVPVFAQQTSRSVTLHQDVTLGSAQLPAGHYRVTWDGTGSNVKVTLFKKNTYGAKPVTATANVTGNANGHKGITVSREGNANELKVMYIGNTEIEFTGTPGSSQ
jgi:hypothetical protein